MTPLGSFVSTTAGCGGGAALARAGTRCFGCLSQVGGAGEPDGAERGELQELPAVDGAGWAGQRHWVGATVRREGLHGTKLTHVPPLQPGRPLSPGRRHHLPFLRELGPFPPRTAAAAAVPVGARGLGRRRRARGDRPRRPPGAALRTDGRGRLPAVPPGRHLQRAPDPRRGRDDRRSRRLHLGRHGTRPADADRPGRLHRQPLPHRSRLAHRRPLGDRDRRRHPDRAVRLHHRPEPLLRGPGRADRAPVADRGAGAHRLGQLAGRQRGHPARGADRRARRGGRRRGGARRGPRPLRGGGRAGAHRQALGGGRRLGHREGRVAGRDRGALAVSS